MFKLLGINDDVTTCECCGRAGLKCTVALESETTGIVHYGRDCAGKALLGSNSRKNTETVDRLAQAVSYARKWLAARPQLAGDAAYLSKISDAIRVRFTNAWTANGKLFIHGVGEIA